ncbi:MAG TPA: hypothetical protein VMI54_23495 [Polyangiaceae bacterium]|nr:hypothetical protein [Polyangiaceae bacterium]
MRNQSLQTLGRVVALGAVAFIATTAEDAKAADDCAGLPRPVVVVGSSAVKPFMAALGRELASLSDPVTLIYQSPGSCAGQNTFVSPGGTGKVSGTGLSIYDSVGTAGLTCDITSNGGTMAMDIAISDVFAASCGYDTLPTGIAEFRGPVQSMVFAVSSNSSRTHISAEAAYLTLGLGADGGTFWSDPTKVFLRDATSGTQQMIAHAVGLPAASLIGTSTNAAGIQGGLQAAITGGQELADQSIGILGMDVIMKPSTGSAGDYVPLAYQHFGQTAGYYPNSDLTAFDMQNTRDGHYMIQGPVHMFTKVDSHGVPTKAEAKLFVDYMTGATATQVVDLIHEEAILSIVPDCAMRVRRDEEIGPFMSYMPPQSCECKFLYEANGKTAPDGCNQCDPANNDDNGVNTTDCTDTSRQHCNFGFCEVQ